MPFGVEGVERGVLRGRGRRGSLVVSECWTWVVSGRRGDKAAEAGSDWRKSLIWIKKWRIRLILVC